MSSAEWMEPRVSRSVFTAVDGFDDDDVERLLALVRLRERLAHLETLRRITYGYSADARLNRLLDRTGRLDRLK